MRKLRKTEVVVAGAGPVGLLAAVALAEQGVDVVVVDEVDRSAVHGYALALHPGSLELLDELGLADDLVSRGQRIESVALYDGDERKAEIRLGELDSSFPFALSLSQPDLEERLRAALERRKVKVRWSHRLAAVHDVGEPGGSLCLAIDRLEGSSAGYPVAAVHQTVASRSDVESEYLVAADGHRSTARRLLGLGFDPVGGPRAFAVFELAAELEAVGEMRVDLSGSTSAALWPLPGGRCRFAFELEDAPPARADQRRQVIGAGSAGFPEIARERLQAHIEAHASWFGAVEGEVLWSVAIRFDPRLVTSLGGGRAWLVGDAAHVTLPMGMQSMNLGLIEATELAQAIATALPGGSGRDLFTSFADERIAEARALLRPGEAFVAAEGADPWIAERIERLVPCLPASGAAISTMLDQVGVLRARGAAKDGR